MSEMTDEMMDYWPEDDFESHDFICNRCGTDDLYWEHDDRVWFLVDADGERHECPPIDPSEFPLV